MKIEILTIFPDMCFGPLNESMLKQARNKGLVDISLLNLRDFTEDKHRSTDDKPYGGGAGMIMKPEPIFKAVNSIRNPDSKIILMSPKGKIFTQKKAEQLAKEKHLIFICGHYEGVDDRVAKYLADEEISIGNYILTNGAIASIVVIDALVRLIPGVLGGGQQTLEEESFSNKGTLEYPQYTRPFNYEGMQVPEILISGDHEKIKKWRKQKTEESTSQI
jgi:tRNA (guanine37-N1)-methyltransferase